MINSVGGTIQQSIPLKGTSLTPAENKTESVIKEFDDGFKPDYEKFTSELSQLAKGEKSRRYMRIGKSILGAAAVGAVASLATGVFGGIIGGVSGLVVGGTVGFSAGKYLAEKQAQTPRDVIIRILGGIAAGALVGAAAGAVIGASSLPIAGAAAGAYMGRKAGKLGHMIKEKAAVEELKQQYFPDHEAEKAHHPAVKNRQVHP